MMRKAIVLVVIAFLTSWSVSFGGGEKELSGDLKKVQGTWKFTVHSMGGKDSPKEVTESLTITFSGDKWTVKAGDTVVQAGTQKLDSSKKPAQVDTKVTEGEGKGNSMLGIYEIKGDTMKVCFDPQGKERPTSLTAKEGQFSGTMERLKKK